MAFMETLGAFGKGATAINSIASLFGGGSNQAQMESQANSQIWQREMRDSAWQSTVSDMKLAGINPMAAFGSGPTSAGSASGSNGYVPKGLQRAQAVQATSSAMLQAETVDKTRAETELLEAQKLKTEAEIPAVTNSAANTAQQTENLKATLPKISAEIAEIVESKNLKYQQGLSETTRRVLMDAQERVQQIERELKIGQLTNVEAMTETQKIITKLRALEIPGAKNQADYDEAMNGAGQVGQAAGKVINSASKIFGGRR